MSRSRRKTPIFGIGSLKSERQDKHIWHSRMRARIRTGIGSTVGLEGYAAPTENEVGQVWTMAKDGKHYFRPKRQIEIATKVSLRGKTKVERVALRTRYLRKLVAK